MKRINNELNLFILTSLGGHFGYASDEIPTVAVKYEISSCYEWERYCEYIKYIIYLGDLFDYSLAFAYRRRCEIASSTDVFFFIIWHPEVMYTLRS